MIIVPWASEWNDRERPFIQSHKIRPQKIDFENINGKTKNENQQNDLKVVTIASSAKRAREIPPLQLFWKLSASKTLGDHANLSMK